MHRSCGDNCVNPVSAIRTTVNQRKDFLNLTTHNGSVCSGNGVKVAMLAGHDHQGGGAYDD